jgi:hypothetical protein
MTYYLAPSLVKLRDQIDSRWPKRDKASDGWIGDASHQATKSDHNPDYANGGIVRAIDVDEDGIDTAVVLEAVLHDPRVSYVIYEGRIWGGTRWRPYTGLNAHEKHIHISLKHTKAAEQGHAWTLALPTVTVKPAAVPKPAAAKPATGIGKKQTVHLPRTATVWGVYRVGARPVAKNVFAYLAPARYNGMTYTIKGWTVPGQVALIDTQKWGRVQIYVAKGSGAVIKDV